MVDIETLKMVKDELFIISTRIPNFINTSSQVDFMIWPLIRHISNITLSMVSSKIHSESLIHLQSDAAGAYYDEILDYINSERVEILRKYIMLFLDKCLNICIQNELFEASHNLSRFKDRFLI
jgi:hypothetical protein